MSDTVEQPKGVLNIPVPVLPLRDIVVFPHMIVPLFVGREKSVRALEEVMNEDKQILLLTQKNAAEDDPTTDGLHTIGTLATVLQLLKLPDQTVRVLVEGRGRARVTGFIPRSDFFQATVEKIPDSVGEARTSIGCYLNFYNTQRPHSSLDGMTPDQAYYAPLPIRVAA